MVRRFYTMQEIGDGLKEMDAEIADAFFKGETHANVTKDLVLRFRRNLMNVTFTNLA